jgi:hypothetical protein
VSRRLRLFALIAATAGCLIPAGVPAAAAPGDRSAAAAPLTEAQAQQIGLDAYTYGIPLMEFVRQAKQQTSVTVPNDLSDAPLNLLGSARHLASATRQVIVQPNLDTLYTMGHVDLKAGPLVLHVPAVTHHRYYSFELMDPYTNVFAYVGTRTTGDGAENFLITDPGWMGRVPRGLRRIRSPYRRAWIVGRTLAYSASDLPAVHKIQDGYKLIPLADYEKLGDSWTPPRPRRIVTKHKVANLPTGLAYFDELGTALAQNPPPARDRAILAELRRVGVGPGLHPSRERLSPALLDGLKAAAAGGLAHIYTLRLSIATPNFLAHDGWFVPPPDTGDYGTDYAFRGVVAIYGIAANRPAEALYIIGAADQTGALLSAAHRYVVHFAAGQLPPARYFWSLTVYDQNFFLVANPLGRYELSSHTRGLHYNADGSLSIYLQHTAPVGHDSNWIPIPSTGQFEATLRLYGPKQSVLDGAYAYPPIVRTD